MIPDKQFVFIIGAPRSGTTWLQAMAASHPSVCSTIDELKFFDFFTVPLEEGWRYLLSLQKETGGGRNGLAAMWSDEDFYRFLSDFAARVYGQVLARKPQAIVLLDKAPAYSLHVEHIDRVMPGAKFVHLIRDGRDVAVSLMAAAQGWAKSWAPKRTEAAALAWKSHVLAARAARQFGDRYLEIRYERLLANGTDALKELFEFIHIPSNDAELKVIYEQHRFENMKQQSLGANNFLLPGEFFRKGEAGDWRNSMTAEQRYVFHEAAGDLLCALGYGDSAWWVQRPHQRLTVPLLLTLSSRSRLKAKAAAALQHALGRACTEKLRALRSRNKEKNAVGMTASG